MSIVSVIARSRATKQSHTMQRAGLPRSSAGSLAATAIFFLLTSSFFLPVPVARAAQACAEQYPNNCSARFDCQITAGERHFIRSKECICAGDCKLDDFTALAVEASRFIFGITGSLALLMFAVGGFWWLTAAGVAERIEKGKKTLVAAVVGIVIIFGAWVIVNSILVALTGKANQCGVAEVLGGTWTREGQCKAGKGKK